MRIMPLAASIVGGVAIAVIAYTAYWFVAADEIEDRIAGWAAEQQARFAAQQQDEYAHAAHCPRFSSR